tara:strand:- start:136268 stop:137200 length:933 start_codon:yes stop_codon:yes gene_type:complete
MEKEFHSNGKLLISAEYCILDGATGLAIPTKYGQSLKVTSNKEPKLKWNSLDNEGNSWFAHSFDLPLRRNTPQNPSTLNSITQTLAEILIAAQERNPLFLTDCKGYHIETKLDFPRNWGLGSSSTLINNIAQWSQLDPFELLWASFPGSGYDIACARHNRPLLYRLQDKVPVVKEVDFSPPFADQLYFLYLNRKQDSREGMAHYRQEKGKHENLLSAVSEITQQMLAAVELENFMRLMERHETLLSITLDKEPVKKKLFPSFKGSIKSLGAWGGDFVLVAHTEDPTDYFHKLGYNTIIPFKKMILSPTTK